MSESRSRSRTWCRTGCSHGPWRSGTERANRVAEVHEIPAGRGHPHRGRSGRAARNHRWMDGADHVLTLHRGAGRGRSACARWPNGTGSWRCTPPSTASPGGAGAHGVPLRRARPWRGGLRLPLTNTTGPPARGARGRPTPGARPFAAELLWELQLRGPLLRPGRSGHGCDGRANGPNRRLDFPAGRRGVRRRRPSLPGPHERGDGRDGAAFPVRFRVVRERGRVAGRRGPPRADAPRVQDGAAELLRARSWSSDEPARAHGVRRSRRRSWRASSASSWSTSARTGCSCRARSTCPRTTAAARSRRSCGPTRANTRTRGRRAK